MAITADPNHIESLLQQLKAFGVRAAQNAGSNAARKPAHRVKFHWPPHPISYSFHVLASDWSGKTQFEAYGETFEVQVARTANGIFGRCEAIWLESRGETVDAMIANLIEAAQPLFQRQFAIARALELPTRFTGQIRNLSPLEQIKILYCDDRDAANEARTEFETQTNVRHYLPLLVAVLQDRIHPNRRTAQWCVLDLFEDLPSFCETHSQALQAVEAMKQLIWDAEDDYARTVYKAGVVLGGHLPYDFGGPVLLECLHAPSKIGRRSAIHGLFHVVEWVPEYKEKVVSALRDHSQNEKDPQLMEYAAQMAEDIEAEGPEHVIEPVFSEEA